MNRSYLQTLCILFLCGALLGAISAPVIAKWVVNAAPADVQRASEDGMAWAWLSFRGALAIGVLFASAPWILRKMNGVEATPRTLLSLLTAGLIGCAAAIVYVRNTAASFSAADFGHRVLISPASMSFAFPCLLGIVAIVCVSFAVRFRRDQRG